MLKIKEVMMPAIDGFKTSLRVTKSKFQELQRKLDFSEEKKKKGLIVSRVAKFRNIIFEKRVNSNYLEIRGSLHKFHHSDNNELFYHHELVESIWALSDILDVSPDNLKLQNCEIEALLSVSNCRKVLLPNIFQANGFDFRTPSKAVVDAKAEVYDRRLEQSERIVKVYNRITHSPDLVRYEIRYVKSRQFIPLGIEFMSDLLSRKWMLPAVSRLKSTFKSILMFDITLDKSAVAFQDYRVWGNHGFWSSLKGMEKKREKEKYLMAVKKHSEMLQEKLLLQIDQNYELLSNHN